MIEIEIPGFRMLRLSRLALDYNGTLAVNGNLITGVKPRLSQLAGSLSVHVITADTFGKAASALDGIDCQLVILPPGNQATAKANFIRQLGEQATIAVGNGRNDRLMLEQAGIAVLGEEGAACACTTAARALASLATARRQAASAVSSSVLAGTLPPDSFATWRIRASAAFASASASATVAWAWATEATGGPETRLSGLR